MIIWTGASGVPPNEALERTRPHMNGHYFMQASQGAGRSEPGH
jgi:hypothetical protein